MSYLAGKELNERRWDSALSFILRRPESFPLYDEEGSHSEEQWNKKGVCRKCQFPASGADVQLFSLLSFVRGKVLRRKTRSEKNRKTSVLWPEKYSRTQSIIEDKINNISKLLVRMCNLLWSEKGTIKIQRVPYIRLRSCVPCFRHWDKRGLKCVSRP